MSIFDKIALKDKTAECALHKDNCNIINNMSQYKAHTSRNYFQKYLNIVEAKNIRHLAYTMIEADNLREMKELVWNTHLIYINCN